MSSRPADQFNRTKKHNESTNLFFDVTDLKEIRNIEGGNDYGNNSDDED